MTSGSEISKFFIVVFNMSDSICLDLKLKLNFEFKFYIHKSNDVSKIKFFINFIFIIIYEQIV